MEATMTGVYTDEIQVQKEIIEKFPGIVQRAATRLGWAVMIVREGNTVVVAEPADALRGEYVDIRFNGNSASVRFTSVNEYYYDEAISREHAAALKQAVTAVIQEDEIAMRNLHPMNREKYGALVFSKSYKITPFIVYTNAIVYLIMTLAGVGPLSPTAASLFDWGGNFRPAVAEGEWWRLFSYMFLHAGILHLVMNTYALLYIGMFLEPLLGRFRFFSAYLLTGLCAGLLSMTMHTATVSVGASGAIFGMYGVFLSMLTTNHIQRSTRRTMIRSILFFVVFNLMMGLQGNTDNAAHIGGLLSGLLIGYAYYPGIARKQTLPKQIMVTAVIAVVVGIIAAIRIATF
jgi:rhomboid protease GluP